MDDLASDSFDFFIGQWGMTVVVIFAYLFLKFLSLINHYYLHRELRLNNYPCVGERPFLSFLYFYQTRKNFGRTWLIRRSRKNMQWVALFIGAVALLRTVLSHQGTEIARAGGLICAAGLLAIYFGFKDERISEDEWIELANWPDLTGEEKNNLLSSGKKSREEAARSALMVSFTVSIWGTLIWAFADQILVCGIYPLLNSILHTHISDIAASSCFQ